MKLVIFGASGGTGRLLVEQALAQDYTVTAFVRNPARLSLSHPNLNVVEGDVLNLTAVKMARAGQEAVLSALGAPPSEKTNIRSEGTQNIIQAMKEAKVRRLICLTALGMGNSRKLLPFSYKYIIVPFLLRTAFADSERQEAFIKQSDLDWTIVRPAALTNTKLTGFYQQCFTTNETKPKLAMKIAHADVADFMLKQVKSTGYLLERNNKRSFTSACSHRAILTPTFDQQTAKFLDFIWIWFFIM